MSKKGLHMVSVAVAFAVSFALITSIAGAVGPGDINWDRPVSMVDRITAQGPVEEIPAWYDDYGVDLKGKAMLSGYKLPEGWKEAAGDVKELTMTNSGSLPHDPATVINAKIFEKMTGIHINIVEMTDPMLWPKQLSVLMAKSTGVDMFYNTRCMLQIPHLSAANWAYPVDVLWPSSTQKLYPPKLLEAIKGLDGKFYSSPHCLWGMYFYYRPSWLAKAGVTVPTTWQDLVTASKKVDTWAKDELGPGYAGMVYAGGDPDQLHQILGMTTYSQGKKLIKDGKFVVDSKAWQLICDLWLKGGMSDDSLEYLWSTAPEVFAKGRAGFNITGGVYMPMFSDPEFGTGIQDDWKVTLTPGWEGIGNPAVAPAGNDAWTINPYISDAKKAASLLWIDYMRSYQYQFNELYVEGNESSMPQVYDHPAVGQKVMNTDLRRETVEKQIAESYPPAMMDALELFKEYLGNVVVKDMDPDKALEELQSQINMMM